MQIASNLEATDSRNPAPSSLATRAVMRANRGKDTGLELDVRRRLRANGLLGYRLHRRIAGTRPDITFGPQQIAVFVHGCYWHRCPTCARALPRSNTGFWRAKFSRNRARDTRHERALRDSGWSVLIVWGHELKATPEAVIRKIAVAVRRGTVKG